MRGVRGVGIIILNKYTIRTATQGRANYILESAGEIGKKMGVAIAYDCRVDLRDLKRYALIPFPAKTKAAFNAYSSEPILQS